MVTLIDASKKQLRRCWQRIRQSGSTERSRELSSSIQWAEQTIQTINTEQEHLRAEFAELESAWFAHKQLDNTKLPRAHFYHTWAARACKVAGACVTALEVVFAGGLSILMLAISWGFALLVGAAITVLLALGLKGVIAPMVLGRYAERPKEGRDLALRILYIAAPIAFALLGAVFVIRGLAGTLAAALFAWCTGALAVLSPVIAAALFVLAGLYGWSRRLAQEYRDLEHLKSAVTELRDYCTRALHTPQAGTTTAEAGIPPIAKAGVLMLLAILVNINVGCVSSQGASWPTVQIRAEDSKAQRSEPKGAHWAEAEEWDDVTSSVAPGQLEQAQQVIRAVLEQLAQKGNIERITAFTFGEQPWSENPYYEITLEGLHLTLCAPKSEAARIFKVQQGAESTTCEQDRHRQESMLKTEVTDAMKAMRAATDQHHPKAAKCTSVGDLLIRESKSKGPRLVFIATDGIETCRSQGIPMVPSPEPDVHVFIVLVDSVSSNSAGTVEQRFAERRRELLASAPWLTVVAPWQLHSAVPEPKE